MITLDERARTANGRSRMCAKCQFGKACHPDILFVCSRAYVDGYKHGWKEHTHQVRSRRNNGRL